MESDELTPEQALEAAIREDLGVGPSAPAAHQSAESAEPKGDTPPVGAASTSTPPPAAQADQPPSWTPKERVFKHNGQEVRYVPSSEDEEVSLLRQGYDYTRKTMELAEQRRQLETVAREIQTREQARQEELRNLLLDKERLRNYLNALEGGTTTTRVATQPTPTPAGEDDDLISRAEATRLAEEAARRAIEAAERTAREHGQALKQELEVDRLANSYRADFDHTIDKLVREQFPTLLEFGPPDIQDRIKAEGQKFLQARMTLQPGVAVDPGEIKTAMADAARRWNDHYEGRLREREKRFALSQATVVTKGTEPRGGSPPPAPSTAKLKLNDPRLDEQVLAEIQSIMGR